MAHQRRRARCVIEEKALARDRISSIDRSAIIFRHGASNPLTTCPSSGLRRRRFWPRLSGVARHPLPPSAGRFVRALLVAPISSSAHSLLTFPFECLNCAKIPSSAAGSSSPPNAPIAPMIFRCSTSSAAIHFVLFVRGMNPRRRLKCLPIALAIPIPMVPDGSCASFPINFQR